MGERSMTVRRFEAIRRRLSEGRGLREIARALGCSRDTVREVRDGLRVSPDGKAGGCIMTGHQSAISRHLSSFLPVGNANDRPGVVSFTRFNHRT